MGIMPISWHQCSGFRVCHSYVLMSCFATADTLHPFSPSFANSFMQSISLFRTPSLPDGGYYPLGWLILHLPDTSVVELCCHIRHRTPILVISLQLLYTITFSVPCALISRWWVSSSGAWLTPFGSAPPSCLPRQRASWLTICSAPGMGISDSLPSMGQRSTR